MLQSIICRDRLKKNLFAGSNIITSSPCHSYNYEGISPFNLPAFMQKSKLCNLLMSMHCAAMESSEKISVCPQSLEKISACHEDA